MIRKHRDDDEDDAAEEHAFNESLEHLSDRDRITLIAERQRMVLQRLARIERKNEDNDRMMQRGMGAAAVIVTLGGIVGWLVSIGKNIGYWFTK